jgi:hypothetical protein
MGTQGIEPWAKVAEVRVQTLIQAGVKRVYGVAIGTAALGQAVLLAVSIGPVSIVRGYR